ncbi:MAG TPA: hypothetical protein VH764_06735 [Gemmatimonadales bacterium]
MSREALGSYLNDHLAGSVSAIELAERVIRENEGDPLAVRLGRVLDQIREDQAVLKGVLERMGVSEHPLKKAGAWLAEKAARVKLGGTDEPGDLSRLEVLETLSTGIHGKQSLWRALRVVAGRYEELRGIDFDRLERRGIGQHDEVEEMRLAAAKEVL